MFYIKQIDLSYTINILRDKKVLHFQWKYEQNEFTIIA